MIVFCAVFMNVFCVMVTGRLLITEIASCEVVEKLFPVTLTSLAATFTPYSHPVNVLVVIIEPVEFVKLRHIPVPFVRVLFMKFTVFDPLTLTELHMLGVARRIPLIVIYEEFVILIRSIFALFAPQDEP